MNHWAKIPVVRDNKVVIMSKKLINCAEDVVDEALAGLVAISPGLTLLEGHRVVVRNDVKHLQKVIAQLCVVE